MAMFDKEDASLSSIILLGDIIISYETVKKEANMYKISFQEHMLRLFLHGILHIFGFDHKNNKQALIMYNFENRILREVNLKTKALTGSYWD